jgi:hypothetical protein
MTIVLKRNPEFELTLVHFSGTISAEQLEALMRIQASDPAIATNDALQILATDADMRAVSFEDLDRLRALLHDLIQPIDFQLVRRSAFICHSPDALEQLKYWLRDRSGRDGIKTEPKLCDSMEEAREWLLLTPEELADAAAERGFEEIARFPAKAS